MRSIPTLLGNLNQITTPVDISSLFLAYEPFSDKSDGYSDASKLLVMHGNAHCAPVRVIDYVRTYPGYAQDECQTTLRYRFENWWNQFRTGNRMVQTKPKH